MHSLLVREKKFKTLSVSKFSMPELIKCPVTCQGSLYPSKLLVSFSDNWLTQVLGWTEGHEQVRKGLDFPILVDLGCRN